MNKLTLADILTKVDTLHEAALHHFDKLHEAALHHTDSLHEAALHHTDSLHEAALHHTDALHEAAMQRIDTLDEAVTRRIDTLDEAVTARFDNVERTLDEHSAALLELATISTEHSVLHREHSLALGRIERRQGAETRALDSQETRITAIEKRPYPSAPAS